MSIVSSRPHLQTWRRIKRAQVNSGTTPWDFSSIDLSSAGSTATRSTTSPLYEGASYLAFACSGVDGENGRARAMIEPTNWATQRYLRATFALFLPTGFSTSIVAGGTAQVWKFDCFPTVNCQVLLLYYQGDNTHKLVCKEAGTDTDITNSFTISENAWHAIDITMRLSAVPTGWARVRLDGVEVARGYRVKTIYRQDNGSGHKAPYIRFGLSAHGASQTAATALRIDDAAVDVAP